MNPGPKNSGGGTTKGKRRWIGPLLVVSLALNLLFVGLIAGSWWRHGERASRNKVFSGAVERLMQELPEAKRAHTATLLENHRNAVKPVRGQIRQARDIAKDAVLAEPYDEERVKAALTRFRDIRNSQHEAMHTMVLGMMKELNLEERQKLLDYIRDGFKSRRGSGADRKEQASKNQ